MERSRTIRRWGLVIVAGLYLTSLFLPAIDLGHSDPPAASGVARGWEVTAMGGILLFAGSPLVIPVLANPVHWVGWLLLAVGHPRAARTAGVIGLILAASTWAVPMGELLVGHYVWLASMAALVVAGIAGDRRWGAENGPEQRTGGNA